MSFLQIMDSDYFESRVMQDQDLEPIISGLYGTGGGEPLNVEDIESLWISLAAKYSKLYDKRTYLRQYEGTIDKGLYGELLEILLVRPAVNCEYCSNDLLLVFCSTLPSRTPSYI